MFEAFERLLSGYEQGTLTRRQLLTGLAAAAVGSGTAAAAPQSTGTGGTAVRINHINLRQGGKLYDVDLFNLGPGDTMTATQMSGYTAAQAGDEAPAAGRQ